MSLAISIWLKGFSGLDKYSVKFWCVEFQSKILLGSFPKRCYQKIMTAVSSQCDGNVSCRPWMPSDVNVFRLNCSPCLWTAALVVHSSKGLHVMLKRLKEGIGMQKPVCFASRDRSSPPVIVFALSLLKTLLFYCGVFCSFGDQRRLSTLRKETLWSCSVSD